MHRQFFFSCQKKDDFFTIVVTVKQSPFTKIYFTDAYDWQTLLDSASGKGRFVLRVPKYKLEKSLYSLYYFEGHRQKPLEFDNRILSPDSTKYLQTAFIPDCDTVWVDGDMEKSRYFSIRAGEETSALFATQMMDFGMLDADPAKRMKKLQSYISVVKEHPSSWYLLTRLNESKATLKKSELELLLSGFDSKVMREGIGKSLRQYAEVKKSNPILPKMILEDDRGGRSSVTEKAARLTMIVLWASWCSPCRREIPAIKTLEKKYRSRGLQVISISIDKSKENWRRALASENMPWKQFIVLPEQTEEFADKFESGSVPDVLFINSQGEVLERFIGLNEGQQEAYDNLIERNLK